ncbi:MAG: autotransporter domain-containing protein [Planctomycetaceae bacterium]|jgi:hypothetical protein|nr:autotransporter domain-containing protein [Planctomycetaceae bacterium]
MKTKNLWKYALSGLLLASMSLCALAQVTPSVTVPNRVTTVQTFVTNDDVGVLILGTGANSGEVDFEDATGAGQVLRYGAGTGSITLQGVDVQNVNYNNVGTGSAGVAIRTGQPDSLSDKTINTGNINFAGRSTRGMAGFYYETDNALPVAFDGDLKIGDVNVRNDDNTSVGPTSGVTFRDTAGITADIVGKVTTGNITVQGFDAHGFGAKVLRNSTEVTLGNVDVTAGASNLWGNNGVIVSHVGENDGAANGTAKLTVGDVNVTSAGGLSVAGINFRNINNDGVVEAKNVTVKSTGAGVAASGVWGELINPQGKFSVEKVQVDSAADAFGIIATGAAGASAFSVTKDVVARSSATAGAGANVIGISTNGGNNNLTIDTTDGDVQISGIANQTGNNVFSIDMRGGANDTLTITGANKHSNRGQEFDVVNVENVRWATDAEYNPVSSFVSNIATRHQVATGNTAIVHGFVAVNGGNTYTVGSAADNQNAGTLVLHNLTAGNVTVNNGLLALDGSTRSTIGTLTIGNNNAAAQAPAAVALYGNTKAGNIGLAVNGAPAVLGNAVVDPTTGESVLSLSTITEYTLNAGKTAYVANNRKRASLADGFLLPASIHRYNTGWAATRDHLISGGQRVKSGKGILGQAPCDPCEPVCDACEPVCDACEPVCEPCEPTCDDVACNPCDPCGSKGLSIGRSVWVNYIGRSNSYQSSYTNIGIANGDWEIGTDGVQVGLDLFKTAKAQLGLLFGYEGSKATLRSDRLDADDVYFGAYAARVFSNGADFRAVYNYGSQDYKLTRLDPGLGFDWHSHNSAFDGNTHEVNLELGKRFFANRRWSYRPVIGFDLLVNNWDAAQEDGNLATAIAYNDADYTQAFLRIGSDLKFVKGGFVFNSGLYYSYDLNGDELKTKVFARDGSKLGYDKAINSTLYGSKLGRSVLTFNVGGSLALSSRTSVFGGFTGDNSFDRDGDKFQSNGYVGLQYQW